MIYLISYNINKKVLSESSKLYVIRIARRFKLRIIFSKSVKLLACVNYIEINIPGPLLLQPLVQSYKIVSESKTQYIYVVGKQDLKFQITDQPRIRMWDLADDSKDCEYYCFGKTTWRTHFHYSVKPIGTGELKAQTPCNKVLRPVVVNAKEVIK